MYNVVLEKNTAWELRANGHLMVNYYVLAVNSFTMQIRLIVYWHYCGENL